MKLSNKLLIVLAVLLISALFVGNAFAMSGSGTESDPYIVTNAQDLQSISSKPSAYYELGNDISLSGVTWTTFAFSGHLDGKNHVISDLTHTNALFTSFTGEMKDITFSDFEITSTSANSGIVTNSISGNSNIMSNIVVTDSSIVSTGGNVGGFAGTSNGVMSGVTVKDSYVKGSGNYVGGLLGNQDNNPTSTYVSDCNSFNNYIENTNTNGYAGGLIGRLYPLNNIAYNLVSNCNVKSNYVHCSKSGGLLGYFVPCHAADRWGGTYFYVFDNCKIENNLINGDSYSGGLYPFGEMGSRGFTSPYNPITSLRNSEISNNIIYSNSGKASLISNRMAWTKDSGLGTFESIDSVYKNNVVYTNSGNVFYVSGEIREIWNSGTVTISDSNFYGATVQPTPNYVVLENVTNTMDVYYTSNPVMDVEQLTDEGLVHIDIFKGIGTVLNVDTSNHVVNSGITFNDGLTTFNDYPSVTYENTYAKGTYTATANFGFINPSDLSTTLKSTSKQFVVKSGDVEPTIEDVTTSSSTIIQTGDVDVTLSATITPPPDYTIDSIQWQYSVDNTTFSNIVGATTAVSTWRVPVGNYYVRVLVTVDGVATPSDSITQTAYGLPTIDFATLDGKSDSDVAFLRNTRVVCDGGYTPSSNPVPDTYSQWQSSSNGGTVWSTIDIKNVDYTTWTAYTTGSIKIRYAVGDDDSGIFVSKVFNVTVVKPQSITVVADKTDAGIGETVTLTATITNPHPDASNKWQSSPDNDVYTDISDETGLTYDFVTSNVGTMYYRFVSTTQFGTYHSAVVSVRTYGAPTVSANVSPLSTGVDSEITLTGSVTVNPTMGDSDYSVQWKYSDDNGVTWNNIVGGNVLNTVTSFDSGGDYKIKLVVTDDYYTVDSTVFDVEVISIITIDSASVTPTTAKISDIIYLNSTVTSDTPSFTVQWKYKPSTSTEWSNVVGGNVQNCTISGLSVGNYNIKLIASNDYGSTESSVFNLEVVPQPSVTASVDKQRVTVGDNVVFTFTVTDESQYEGESSLEVSYDDGESWTELVSDITSPYSYKVEVSNESIYRIAYENELYSVYSNEMTVTGYDIPVISNITLDVSDGKIGLGDSITASTTITSELNIDSYWWYANVNTPSTKIQAQDSEDVTTYTYEDLPVGEYIIGIYVIDELDNEVTGVCNTHVKVYGQPTVSVNINPSTVNVDETITLTSVVTPDATMGDDSYTVQWKYSNDNGVTWNNIVNGDSENITTSFSTYGEYEIKLVVTDDYFTVDSQILTCNVVVAPVISSFSVSPSKVAINEVINLNSTVTSETGNYSVQWSYKTSESSVWTDITGGNVENTTLSLSTAGVYDIKLTATNEYGSVYEEDEVTVVAQPVISISLNETDITLGDSVTLTESIIDSETGVSDIYVSYDSGSTWEYVTEMSGLTQVLTPNESGIVKYKVTYDNDLYELDSNIVSLNVYDVPVVSSVQITPSSGKIGYGNSITASVEVESELQTTNSWWYSQSGVKTTIPNSNVDEFEYTNLAVGEYTIGVDVRDSLGNTVTQTCSSTIYVYGAPSISISTSSHNVAVNTPITISKTVTVNETLGDEDYTSNIMVSYNGGEYVNCTSPYTVTQTGVYYFKGVVSDNYFSHIESSIETVNVGTIPAVTGSVDSDKVSTGSTIYLTGNVQSELTVEDYGWKYSTDGISYSDITTQSDYSASFLCSNAGTYYFKFFAENSLGIGESNVLTVNAYDARTITVTAMPSIVSTSMSISLTANVTTPSHASSIVSKGWELNHNGVWESMGIQDETTSYIPQNYGDYLFRYKIVDEIGVTSISNTATVTVSDKPTVSIIVPENAIAGQSVLFTADVASLLEISSEKWYVDNIQVGTGESLVYTFNDLGDYVVRFTAENELGETSAYSIVHVYNVPVISDFTIQSQSIEYGGYQTVTVESNVDSQGLMLQQNYEGRGWTNIGIPFIHSYGNTYTLTYKVQTDAGYGGNVDVRVVATNPVGSVTSDVKSFTVEGKQPTEYSKAFTKADGMAQTAIIIAAIVMLVIIGIFVVTVCTGTLEPMMALKALGIIAIVFIVIICLIVFIGSLSGVTAPLL